MPKHPGLLGTGNFLFYPLDDIRYWIMFAALLETELIIMEIEGGGDAHQGPTAANKRP